jgi:hypothetical protein
VDLEALCWGARALAGYSPKQIPQVERSPGGLPQAGVPILEFYPKS